MLYKYIDYNLDTEKYENGTTIKMPKISCQNPKRTDRNNPSIYYARLTHILRQFIWLGEPLINN